MAAKLLANQLRELHRDPVEGFAVELEDEANLFVWRVWIEGPKDTPFEGGVFQARLTFPPEFPLEPPTLQFVGEFWHPNVYRSGDVCISILHAPGEDAMSGEDASERWLPTRSVSAVLLSVISMLSSPNFSSPANVDASVECRDRPEEFRARVAKIVARANANRPPGLVIPHPESDPEQHRAQVERIRLANESADLDEMAQADEAELYEETGGGDSTGDAETEDAGQVHGAAGDGGKATDGKKGDGTDTKGKGRCPDDVAPSAAVAAALAPAPAPPNGNKRHKKGKRTKCSVM